MTRTKISAFFQLPSQLNHSLKEKHSYIHSFLLVLTKVTVLMHVNLLQATVQMEDLRFKVLIFYQSYSIVAHSDSLRINIAITDMHRLTASILDVMNEFHNKNVLIY